MKVYAIVLARGGSQGIPKKNLTPVNGRPLLHYTLDAVAGCEYAIDHLIVSSDSDEILDAAMDGWETNPTVKVAELYYYKRVAELSRAESRSSDAIMDIVWHRGDMMHHFTPPTPDDIIIMLQPTSPLRTAGHILRAIRALESKEFNSVVSVCAVEHPVEWTMEMNVRVQSQLGYGTWLFGSPYSSNHQRQACCDNYRVNGAVFAARASYLLEHKTFVGSTEEPVFMIMDKESSLDIDDLTDVIFVEAILNKRKGG